MPVGQREKSFRSSPDQSSWLTLVAAAIWSREMPRWTRTRRRLGPKASRSPMGATAVIAKTLPNAGDTEPVAERRFWRTEEARLHGCASHFSTTGYGFGVSRTL